jgi:hypothetical protein
MRSFGFNIVKIFCRTMHTLAMAMCCSSYMSMQQLYTKGGKPTSSEELEPCEM